MSIIIIVLVISILIGVIFSKRYNHQVHSHIWSINVFSPNEMIQSLPKKNELYEPTIKASDITDVVAELVADPFLFVHGLVFYLFFEIYNKVTEKGEIGLATSQDGKSWKYDKMILSEKYHLSYPQVFEHHNEFYMIPESKAANKVLLYKATTFPHEWEVSQVLLTGEYVDPSIFQYQEKWWMFAATNGKLHLFYANDLFGEWIEHRLSPLIIHNINITRPAGRVVVENGAIYRYAQEGEPYYGHSVKLFKINKLTEDEYEEEAMGVVLQGTGKEDDWRKDGMHHIDQVKLQNDQWLIAVDGHVFTSMHYLRWKLDRLKSKFSFYMRF